MSTAVTPARTNPLVILALGVAGTAVTLCVMPLVGDWRVLGWARAVGRRSLGVYALHSMLSAVVVTGVVGALPVFKGAGIVVPLVLGAVVVAAAYGVTRALDRWAPVPFLRVWWDTSSRQASTAPKATASAAD